MLPLKIAALALLIFVLSVQGQSDTGSTSENPDCPERCFLPVKHGGRGKKPFVRYYYNGETGECKRFRYTGRYGNKNKFIKKVDCEGTCGGCGVTKATQGNDESDEGSLDDDVNPEDCQLPKENGKLCEEEDANVSWYYDSSEKVCVPFAFYGCGGNKNRFSSQEECKEACDK